MTPSLGTVNQMKNENPQVSNPQPEPPKPPPKDFNKEEKWKFWMILFVWLVLIINGVILITSQNLLSKRLVGLLMIIVAVVVVPWFLYQRWKTRKELLIGDQKPPVP